MTYYNFSDGILLVSDNQNYVNDDFEVYSKIAQEFCDEIKTHTLEEVGSACYEVYEKDGDYVDSDEVVKSLIECRLPHWKRGEF